MKTESTLYFDGRFWVVVIERPNPKRAQRQASRLAHQGRPSTASQAAIHADRERSAQRRAADAKQKKREVADAKYRLEREKVKARHRGH